MKEEKKQAIYKAYIYSEKLKKHIKKLENNSNRENELEFSKCLQGVYTKLDNYENDALCCEDNVLKGVVNILKSNKMFVLFNRMTRKLTDFNGEKISYVNPPKKTIKDKILVLSDSNANTNIPKKKCQDSDYKLLKEICKDLEA